jgi:hypothetical protein
VKNLERRNTEASSAGGLAAENISVDQIEASMKAMYHGFVTMTSQILFFDARCLKTSDFRSESYILANSPAHV